MPGPWVSTPDIRAKIADKFQISDPSLMKIKDTLIDDSSRAAALEIQSFWLVRGYTIAQIDTWDRRIEFNLDLAMFWTLTKASVSHGGDQNTINYLDRRKDLSDHLIFTIGGIPVQPGVSDQSNIASQVGWGRVGDIYIKTLKDF